ncbi:hypothetical protein JOD82_002232 [Paenibacillus sp. 1182]|uniref:hypothetical protein n=1 Tax=Paenibacillus sp. 1182 TaxID=2806565 RepID=UPI001B75E603|nr:hypothetical protein [Paenibacillus sp. 1182]MBP1309212.1 hypothetical protein [Paenibacillus sp. 1182]
MNIHKVLKWVTFGFEAFLAIPLIGGAFILANGWTPLLIVGVLHLISIVLLLANRQKLVVGNLIGIVGAMLGAIPVLGWILHVFTAIVLFLESMYLSKKKDEQRFEYEADL